LGVIVFTILHSIVIYNGSQTELHQVEVTPFTDNHPKYTLEQLSERLAAAIRFPTISFQDSSLVDYEQFEKLHQYIFDTFPLVHQKLELKKIGTPALSLLYIWKGTRFGTPEDKPFAVSSHIDVVPVPEDTLPRWQVDPFAGIVDEEFIWVSHVINN
jgi:carboxypeptidase PM20D1